MFRPTGNLQWIQCIYIYILEEVGSFDQTGRIDHTIKTLFIIYYEVVTYLIIRTLYLSVIDPSTRCANYSLLAVTSTQIWQVVRWSIPSGH